MGTQENLLGTERGHDEDHFGGIGITIGTSIGPEERLRLSQGPEYSADRHAYGDISLAELLRTTRENLGLSLDDVAETTRVRRGYLEALELETYDVLPTRAFAVGFVRAYAKALGLDEETLAEMFKRDFRETQTSLRAPVGAAYEDVKPNYGPYIAAGLGLVAVIAIWNILQWNPDMLGHKEDAQASLASQPWTPGVPITRDGIIHVSKPAQAPKDQDVPDLYVTPGREQEFADMMAERRQPDQANALPATGLTRKAFNPKGAIYGAQPEASLVTLQATRPGAITVRDSKGVVYFTRQLSAGEAYRIPLTGGQMVDVTDAKSFDVYYNGEYAGVMAENVMTVSVLNSRSATAARTMDSDINAARRPTITSAAARRPRPEAQSSASSSSAAPIPYTPPVQASSASSSSASSSSAPKRRPVSQRGPGPVIPGVN